MRLTRKREIVVGSGNVSRDLRLKDPDELLAKATLAARIVQIVGDKPRRVRGRVTRAPDAVEASR